MKTEKYIEELKSYVDNLINLVLSGACQKKNLVEEFENLLSTISKLEDHLKNSSD